MSVGPDCASRLSVRCWRHRRRRARWAREWRHPSTGAPIRFSVSTLERWFYRSRNVQHDPVSVLRRKRRSDAGEQT
jgi:hypothetical protein